MVQIGTTGAQINIIPRIDGAPETQTRIKTVFSNKYVDDTGTPLSFTLEYKKIGGSVNTLPWNPTKSTETVIVFDAPDSMFAEKVEWTIGVFWTIGTEKNYVLKPYHMTVDDVHNQ